MEYTIIRTGHIRFHKRRGRDNPKQYYRELRQGATVYLLDNIGHCYLAYPFDDSEAGGDSIICLIKDDDVSTRNMFSGSS